MQKRDRSLDVSSPLLVGQLNQLLTSLQIPIQIDSPAELTPLLLIGILESILEDRLPIPDDVRALLSSSDQAKQQGIKIFLGVVQSDLLGTDVGLSNMDPRRLARGEDVETLYVARLLCWYGRRHGLVSRPGRSATSASVNSPSTLTTLTPTRHSASVADLEAPESVTTVSNATFSPRRGPHCIHEIPSPQIVLSPLSPHLTTLPSPPFPSALLQGSSSNPNTTVRYEGYIAPVDEDAEIAAFEAQRPASRPRAGPNIENDSDAEAELLQNTKLRNVELLGQKAQLLHQIALRQAQRAEDGL
ncbi:hypothetical protein MKEN_00313400 [Mycena kentingensis (nom. inval.)]|nr:hypothetical protein MKEN_00313400 [Mycena kentingensis (nom. inval.)]